MEITEDLIKKRGVSPSQIPNIFFKCGEEATKLFCSTNCSQKNIPKETNGAKKTYKSKNGSFKIKYFLLSLLKEQNDVIVWINEKEKIFRFVNPARAASLWGSTKPNYKNKMSYSTMSRGLRYLYESGELQKVPKEKYTYKFL